jgi:hypothetical protein
VSRSATPIRLFRSTPRASCNYVNRLPSIHDQENVEIFKEQLSCTFYFLFLQSSPRFLSSNPSLSRSKIFSIPHHAFQSHSCHGLRRHQHGLSSRHKAERLTQIIDDLGALLVAVGYQLGKRYCLYWQDHVLRAY